MTEAETKAEPEGEAPESEEPESAPAAATEKTEEAPEKEVEATPSTPSRERKSGDRSTPSRFSRRPPRVSAEDVEVIRKKQKHAQLCVDDVSVSFDGFQALTDLTLVLDAGELRCIIGPNGAGKTTLMDVITGKTVPDKGRVFFLDDMEDLTFLTEHEIAHKGIGRKFQRPTVFPEHSVRENLELTLAMNKGVWRSLIHRVDKKQRKRIDDVLEKIRLGELAEHKAGSLAHGQKQWLEIGMLLAQDPQVLLVDEPIAGMTHQEIERTAELLSELAGQHTVIVIEHDMDFVRSIATDTVTVLHEGKVLAEGPMDRVQSDPKVVEVYLGE